MGSRWVRYWSRRGTLAALLLALGWSLAALAQAQIEEKLTGPTHHADVGVVITAMLGGGMLLFGFAAGLTRWLIDPVARKIVAEHEAKGVAAHLGVYVPFEMWDKKHDELDRKVDSVEPAIKEHLSYELRQLREDLRVRRGGHE